MKHEPKHCAHCSDLFECKPNAISACHCSQILLNDEERAFISAKYNDCLCSKCLVAIKLEYEQMPLFYTEHGYYVMTVKHHLKRGFCCKNGCRHCPYKNKAAGLPHI
ncbi:MAG: cysteine-rich CWC family protein [Chitinophagales bacterium]|nr:cysteine-rich CWC family protein [Chitinophagales bacterium]